MKKASFSLQLEYFLARLYEEIHFKIGQIHLVNLVLEVSLFHLSQVGWLQEVNMTVQCELTKIFQLQTNTYHNQRNIFRLGIQIYFEFGQIHLVNLVLGGLFIPSITSWLAAPALWLERWCSLKLALEWPTHCLLPKLIHKTSN